MANALQEPFETVVVQDYKHWQTGEKWIDIDYEVEQVADKISGLEPYVVFAKSIGTILTLKAMYEDKLQPHACLFLGTPLNAATDMDLPVKEWFASTNVPIYFMHNQDDPYGSAQELSNILPANIDQTKITVLRGDTHDYNDVEVMRELLARASS